MTNVPYDREAIDEVAEKLNDVFWDAISEGMSYEQAHDEVDDWVGNNYIPDLVDPDTDEVNEFILDLVYARVPTEEDYAEYMEGINYDTE